jgi:Leucine-rich repeat (LRR) protein
MNGTLPSTLGRLSFIKKMDFSRNRLTGTIPASLGTLSALQSLILNSNLLTGTIPESLGNLSALKTLNLCSNQLTGTIPASLGNLLALQDIYLYANQLTGTIPTSFGNLLALLHLSLDSNELSGTIPEKLGTLPTLKRLNLYSNQLIGTIPNSFGTLFALQHMDLSTNQLTGTIPVSLGNLSALQYLVLFANQLTGTIPESLGNLTALKSLYLSANRLSGSIPASLGNLPELQNLDLCLNQLTESIPASLGKLTALQNLNLNSNQFSGTIPESLGNMSALEYLYLYSNQLTGSIPASLGNMSSLLYMYLYLNKLTGTIPSSLGNLPALKTLDLYSNQLMGKIPTSLGNLVALQNLDLYSNQLTGEIPASLGNLSALQYMYLFSNHLSGTVPASLGNLTALQYLNLNSNQLTGSIPVALGNLASIKVFDISRNAFSGDLPILFRSLNSLVQLDLSSNRFSGHFDLVTSTFFPAFINVSNNLLGPRFSAYPRSDSVFSVLDIRSFEQSARFDCPYPNNYPDTVTILRSPCQPSLVEFGIYFGYGSLGAIFVLGIFMALKRSEILHSHIETMVYFGKWCSALACLVMDSLSFQLMVRALLVTKNNCDPMNKFGLFGNILPYVSGPGSTPSMSFIDWFPTYINYWFLAGYSVEDPANFADLNAFRDLCARIPECAVDSIGTTCVVAHPELAQSGKLAFPIFFACLLGVVAVRGLVEVSRSLFILMSIRSRSIVLGELGSIFIRDSAFAPMLYLDPGTRSDFNLMIRHRAALKPTHLHLLVEFVCSAVLTALPLLAVTTYYSVQVAQVGLSSLNMLSIFFTLMNSSSLLVRAFYLLIVPWCQSFTHHRTVAGQKQQDDSNFAVPKSVHDASPESIDVDSFELAKPVILNIDSNVHPVDHHNLKVPLPILVEMFPENTNQNQNDDNKSRPDLSNQLLDASARS